MRRIQEAYPPLEPIKGGMVILEHRVRETIDLVVYEKAKKGEVGNRLVKWVARLGRSDDRDRLIPQQEGPPKALPPGRAYPKQGYIGHIGMVHSPILHLTPQEWDELKASHWGKQIQAMIDHGDLLYREEAARAPREVEATA